VKFDEKFPFAVISQLYIEKRESNVHVREKKGTVLSPALENKRF